MAAEPGARGTVGRHATIAVLLAAAFLAGCEQEEILPGPRFDLRELEQAAEAAATITPADAAAAAQPPQPPTRAAPVPYRVTGEPAALRLPGQRANADWTHPGGSVRHTIDHPALGASLQRVWSAPIGAGNTRRLRLSSDPVVISGRVVTQDTLSRVRAHSASTGGLIWETGLTPQTETPGEAVGGGIAASGNRVFVTTGYGNLHALDLATGAELWRQRLDANPNAAPTVEDGIVYVSSRDGQGWALDADNGRILWQIESVPPGAVTLTGASPAIAGGTVIYPFGNGDLVAALRRGGIRLWATTLSGRRPGRAYAGIGDITGGPVVDGGRIYTANPAGRLAALDAETGDRLWTARDGALSPVWPSGGALFLVTDENVLKRLDAATGEEVWTATLPLFASDRIRRRTTVYAHYGPVLAGGRLILASTDGQLREVDPRSGRLLAARPLPAPAARNPVVAGGTLFIVTEDGQLHAFR